MFGRNCSVEANMGHKLLAEKLAKLREVTRR